MISFLIAALVIYLYALAWLSLHPLALGATDAKKGRPRPIDSVHGSHRRQVRRSASVTTKLLFVLLIPALNEEHVIARTLRSLLRLTGRFLLVVVDDGSDDGTVDAVQPYLANSRVRVIVRPPSESRMGKGAALNAGLAFIRELPVTRMHGSERVIVVVFDADGRVEHNFLEQVAPYFQDPEVGGVQCAVRMHNAGRNLLTLWQQIEFVVWGELFSRAKDRLGSATLGGNGQFVRLAALDALGHRPWRPSLTEDLDLSLRLLVAGWRIRFCDSAAVHQEAIWRIGPLLRQRGRWLQGHFVSWEHLPAVVRSHLPLLTRLDLAAFLLLPAAMLPIGIASVGTAAQFLIDLGYWNLGDVLRWYLLGFATVPLVALALVRRLDRRLPEAIGLAHLYVLYVFVWFAASVIAVCAILAGQRAWVKTSRHAAEAQPVLGRVA